MKQKNSNEFFDLQNGFLINTKNIESLKMSRSFFGWQIKIFFTSGRKIKSQIYKTKEKAKQIAKWLIN